MWKVKVQSEVFVRASLEDGNLRPVLWIWSYPLYLGCSRDPDI